MKLPIGDAKVDVLAIATYDGLLRAIAVIGMLDIQSVQWLRAALAGCSAQTTDPGEEAAFDGFIALCDDALRDE